MKQIAQYQDGRLELQEVPVPVAPPGGVLVRVTHSVISAGTERMKVEQSRMNLVQKARARPDQVRKVLDTARTLGWRSALEKVRNRLETPTSLGYSAAGVVEAVDSANLRFRVGDRVAVGGAECAFHAEYVAVPDLLAAPIPDGVQNWEAAYTTLLSISLQAVRQLEPALGERVLVLGQGLIGLLVTGLLRANGVRVMAVDVAPSRRTLAEAMGAERVVISGVQMLADEVRAWTDGYGVDAVVLCTATQSNAPVEQSADALRDRGRLVIVGNTRTELSWKIFYEKEIEVRYSRSYGPGRYDPTYEWAGVDYPIGYVRWTEQRNFDACLQLLRARRIDLGVVTTRRVPFASCLQIYQELMAEGLRDVGVVLEYGSGPPSHPGPLPQGGEWGRRTGEGAGSGSSFHGLGHLLTPHVRQGFGGQAALSPEEARETRLGVEGKRLAAAVDRLDAVGAGNFARTMLLPHLQGRIRLGTVVNNTSLSADHVRTKFGFESAATEAGGMLGAGRGAAVLIATRHHLHAPLVVAALGADRHVFVEKPLCLRPEELGAIDTAVGGSAGSVQVGFNRRFAGAGVELRELLRSIPGPKTCSYRVMAGKLDPSHWYANLAESGGRVLGEACHFLDFFCFLFGSRPVRVMAQTVWPVAGRLPFPDGVTAQVEFADGSCGQLVYSAEGDPTWPKEQCTVFGAGLVAEIVNFQELVIHRGRRRTRRRHAGKGHAEQMAAWLAFLRGETEHPLPYSVSRQSMLLTFAVLDSIQLARSVELERPEA